LKQNKKLIARLNQILIDELKKVNQNMFLQIVSNNPGFGELNEEIEKDIAEELKQAEWLIKRIVFLEVWRARQSSLSISKNNAEDIYKNVRNAG
jgi:bacterioferritin (cytochrome b1)